MFESIGLGRWFRCLNGGLEVVAAVLLHASSLSGLGGLLVVAPMAGAVFTHAFVIGGDALLALVLGLLGVVMCGCAVNASHRRAVADVTMSRRRYAAQSTHPPSLRW
jgi:hypothetical protein